MMIHLPSTLLLVACGLSGPVDSGDSAIPVDSGASDTSSGTDSSTDSAPEVDYDSPPPGVDLGDPNSTDPALACPPYPQDAFEGSLEELLRYVPEDRRIAVTVDVWDPDGECFTEQVGLYSARYWCPDHGPVHPDWRGDCADMSLTVVDASGVCLWFSGLCANASDPSLGYCNTVEGCCDAVLPGPSAGNRCATSPG